jgi:hypothetical protein
MIKLVKHESAYIRSRFASFFNKNGQTRKIFSSIIAITRRLFDTAIAVDWRCYGT